MSMCKIILVCGLALFAVGLASARWCTRLVAEKKVMVYHETAQCNKSYTDACGWFSSKECTFYELVDCPIERNQTVVYYKIVEECCPGFVRDPISNVTCISKDGKGDKFHYLESDDEMFLGLSHGAIAGIVCCILFVICVTVLIAFRIHKRRRNKKRADESDVGQKMLTIPKA